MGRGFIVEDVVEGYLSRLCERSTSPITGLLIGQNSAQRDFIVMATRTPQRQESVKGFVDKEWICEHGRQVSRMLPGGLSVLGVFIITDSSYIDIIAPLQLISPVLSALVGDEIVCATIDQGTDYLLRTEQPSRTRVVMGSSRAVGNICISAGEAHKNVKSNWINVFLAANWTVCELDKTISTEYLWGPMDDDVIEYVILHVNPKTTITTCRTFNIKDPKSPLKSADWKYQSSVCTAWSMITCCLNVDILLPLLGSRAGIENMDPCLKEGLKVWAHQIQEGFCLFDCKRIPEDMELTSGQKRNVRQAVNAQLLIPLDNQRLTNLVQQCGGSMSIRGAIHSRVFLLGSKLKSKFAEKLLKRDVVSTLATRVSIILEDLLTSDVDCKGTGKDKKEDFSLPRRIFCPIKVTWPAMVCEYQFIDEELADVIERLKEMLDIDATIDKLDTKQELLAENAEKSVPTVLEPPVENVEAPGSQISTYIGFAMATTVVLLATAVSMVYLSDI